MNSERMLPAKCESLADRRVLVMGLGRFGGGVGVTRWLVAQGARVTVADRASPDSLRNSLGEISDLCVRFRLGTHDEHDLDDADLVIVNPAVIKSTSSFFQAIVRRGVPWTTELNLFCERCPAPVIAVTGTFGKSTTCAMLTRILEDAAGEIGISGVHLGGNIGRSLLCELPEIRPSDVVVLEMSNAQLEDIPRISWSPQLAVVTNLSPHHLDRYSAADDYFRAKLNLIRNGTGPKTAVVGELHQRAEVLLSEVLTGRRIRLVRIAAPVPDIELMVPGQHNQRNAVCAWTVAGELGISDRLIRSSLKAFRGLEHRVEFVRTLDGVAFYNDSKSTAPTATIVALQALQRCGTQGAGDGLFARPIICIVGGQRKSASLEECAKMLCQTCRAIVCMGESGPDFAAAVEKCNAAPPMIIQCGALPEALEQVREIAHSGDIVLFSPGAPSFDQYVNFTERGRHFVDLVNRL